MPDKILQQIFAYLEYTDLRKASLVCNRWELLAESSPTLVIFNFISTHFYCNKQCLIENLIEKYKNSKSSQEAKVAFYDNLRFLTYEANDLSLENHRQHYIDEVCAALVDQDYIEIAQEFANQLKKKTDILHAVKKICQLLTNKQCFNEAIKVAKAAPSTEKDSILNSLVDFLIDKNQFNLAKSASELIIDVNTKDTALENIVRAHMASENVDKAKEIAEMIESIDRKHQAILNVCSEINKADDVISFLEKNHFFNADNKVKLRDEDILDKVTRDLLEKDKIAYALKIASDFLLAMGYVNNLPPVFNNILLFLTSMDVNEAIKHAREIAPIQLKDFALRDLSIRLVKENRLDTAAALATDIIDNRVKNLALQTIGMGYYDHGKIDNCFQIINALPFGDQVAPLKKIAQDYVKNGNFFEAEKIAARFQSEGLNYLDKIPVFQAIFDARDKKADIPLELAKNLANAMLEREKYYRSKKGKRAADFLRNVFVDLLKRDSLEEAKEIASLINKNRLIIRSNVEISVHYVKKLNDHKKAIDFANNLKHTSTTKELCLLAIANAAIEKKNVVAANEAIQSMESNHKKSLKKRLNEI